MEVSFRQLYCLLLEHNTHSETICGAALKKSLFSEISEWPVNPTADPIPARYCHFITEYIVGRGVLPDEKIAYALLKRYFGTEYFGGDGDLKSKLDTGHGCAELYSILTDYYRSEVLHRLKCIRYILMQSSLTNLRSSTFRSFRSELNQKIPLITKCTTALENVFNKELLSVKEPNNPESEVIFRLNQASLLLQIMNIEASEYLFSIDDLTSLFKKLCRGILNLKICCTSSTKSVDILSEVECMFSLLFVQLFDIKTLSESAESHIFKSSGEKLGIFTDALMKNPNYPLINLAWVSIMMFYSNGNIPNAVQKIGASAVEHDVFKRICSDAKSDLLSCNSMICGVYLQTIFSLVDLLLTQFDASSISQNPATLDSAIVVLLSDFDNSTSFFASLKSDESNRTGVVAKFDSSLVNIAENLPFVCRLLSSSCHTLDQANSIYHIIQTLEIGTAEGSLLEVTIGSDGYLMNGNMNGWLLFKSQMLDFFLLDPGKEEFVSQKLAVSRIIELLRKLLEARIVVDTAILQLIELLPQTMVLISGGKMDKISIDLISDSLVCLTFLSESRSNLVVSELTLSGILPEIRGSLDEPGCELSSCIITSSLSPAEASIGHYQGTIASARLLRAIINSDCHDIDRYLKISFELACKHFLPQLVRDMTSRTNRSNLSAIRNSLLLLIETIRSCNEQAKKMMCMFLLQSEQCGSLLHILDIGNDNLNCFLEFQKADSSGKGSDLVEILLLTINLSILMLETNNGEIAAGTSRFEQLIFYSNQGRIFQRVVSYLFHGRSSRLPIVTCNFLRILSCASSLSFFSFLGSDIHAVRDRLHRILTRSTEDPNLKGAVIQLLCTCIDSQPAFSHNMMHFEKSTESPSVPKFGSRSVLGPIVEMITKKPEDSPLSTEVKAALEFIHAVWYERQTMLRNYVVKIPEFWHKYVSILYNFDGKCSENVSLTIICAAYVLKTLSMELFSNGCSHENGSLKSVLQKLFTERHLFKWISLIEELAQDLITCKVSQNLTNSCLVFISSLQNLISVSLSRQDSLKIFRQIDKRIVTDMVSSLVDSLSVLVGSKFDSNLRFSNVLSMILVVILKNFEYSGRTQCERLVRLLECSKDTENISSFIKFSSTVISALVIIMQEENADKIDSLPLIKKFIKFVDDSLEKTERAMEHRENCTAKDFHSILMPMMSNLYLRVTDTEFYLSEVEKVRLLPRILRNFTLEIKFDPSSRLCQSVMCFLIQLSYDRKSSALLQRSRIHESISLSLNSVIESQHTKNCATVKSFMLLMGNLLRRLEACYLRESLDVVSCFQQRIVFKLRSLGSLKKDCDILEEVVCILNFLFELSLHVKLWKFHLLDNYQQIGRAMAHAAQSGIALLIRPKYLQYMLLHGDMDALGGGGLGKRAPSPGVSPFTASGGSISRQRSASSTLLTSSTFTLEDAHLSGDELLDVQRKLLEVVSYVLAGFNRMSVPLPQALLAVGSADADTYDVLFHPSFATPALQTECTPSFGTLLSCANYAIGLLLARADSGKSPRRLVDSPATGHLMPRQSISLMLESAIFLLLSQTALCIRGNQVEAASQKLTLARDMAGELTPFMTSFTRYLHKLGLPSLPYLEGDRSSRLASRDYSREQAVLVVTSLFLTRSLASLTSNSS